MKKNAAPKKATGPKGKPAAKEKKELAVLSFEDSAAWWAWLSENHAKSPGVWLALEKKSARKDALDYAGALDAALAWGWIDSQKRAHDASAWHQRFGPRGPRSLWSKINREKVAALLARGEMQPAGMAHVEAARADGRGDAAYDSPSKAGLPEDFAARLEARGLTAKYHAMSSANRYAMLFRLQTAKKPETRERHLARFVEMIDRGETLH